MNDFNPLAPLSAQPHPDKRLKYSLGLVLGADALAQEQFYFLERDRLHARRLHGYGTVCGLSVSVDGPEVTVATGLAVDTRGRPIRVTREYRGNVQSWWGRQSGSPPPALVHVVLCYRECESDTVPVAGTPCRTEEESQAPSRITESFQLLFTTTPPPQAEEAAIDRLGGLLRSIEIVEDDVSPVPDPYLEDASLENLLEAVVNDGALPAGPLWVRRGEFEQRMARLLELWLTEYLPRLGDPTACDTGSDLERSRRCDPEVDGLLLASIDLDDDGMPGALDTTERPLLYPTRLLQEYMLQRDQVVGDHGVLDGLEDDDHYQYLNLEGADAGRDNAMTGDLQMGDNKVLGLAEAEADGEAVRFEQAVKVGDPAAGDLRGSYPDPEVDGVLGRSINNTGGRPLTDSVLVYKRGVSAGTDRWELQRMTLGLLVDVVTSGRDEGDHLVYLNGAWRPIAPAGDIQSDLSDAAAGPQMRVIGLRDQPLAEVSPNPNQVLTYVSGEWTPMDPAGGAPGEADGDVTGPYANLRVVRLRGRDIGTRVPTPGDVLSFFPDQWNPRPVRELPFATLSYLGTWREVMRDNRDVDPNAGVVEIWFHIDAPGNTVEVVVEEGIPDPGTLAFLLESATDAGYVRLDIQGFFRTSRNQYICAFSSDQIAEWLKQAQGQGQRPFGIPLRAVFTLDDLMVEGEVLDLGGTLGAWVRQAGITFSGMDTDRKTVTRFVRLPLPTER